MLDEFRSTSITWDKATRRIYSPITANESDSNGRKLNIQVVNSGQVENLTGATLHLYWETKDKAQHGLDAFTASDISKGEFEIFYTTGMLSNVGELNATLVLVDSTGKVVSDWFKITVARGINEGAIQSENSFTSLTQALIDISNLEQNYAPRLNDLTAQLQQIPSQRPNHYYVGATQKYKTIKSAVDKWISDGRPKATIHLMSGMYKESISILEGGTLPYQLSFVGEDKKNTIWKTTNGYYKDAPLHYHGDCIIQGITFIADHSENPSYAYSNLSGNVWTDDVGGAYALHADFNSEGTMLIKDCDLISYQNAALGSGTRKNQTIRLENVNMWSYTEVATGSEQQLSNGALLYHSFSGTGAVNQKLSLKNVFAFSENGRPLTISNFSPEVGAFEVEMINSNFASNVVTDRALLLKFNPGVQTELPITQNSYGNNIERFNIKYANETLPQKPPLTTETGLGIIAGDLNDITKTQYFQINTTGANTPLAGIAWVGECIAYSSTYVVQHAWQITDVAQKYKRYLKGTTWSAWKKVTETAFNMGDDGFAYTPNANSANNCRLNGTYKCTADVPTNGVAHVVQVIAHDVNYSVQYAWQLSNMAKYKRTLINNVWGTWSAVAE